MSLFGSMTTAIGGLTAQSRALGHISDNVANSQTIGFKRIDTSFVSYITSTSERLHTPGSVTARPDFTHTIQGTIEQVENKTALAVAGKKVPCCRSCNLLQTPSPGAAGLCAHME